MNPHQSEAVCVEWLRFLRLPLWNRDMPSLEICHNLCCVEQNHWVGLTSVNEFNQVLLIMESGEW